MKIRAATSNSLQVSARWWQSVAGRCLN